MSKRIKHRSENSQPGCEPKLITLISGNIIVLLYVYAANFEPRQEIAHMGHAGTVPCYFDDHQYLGLKTKNGQFRVAVLILAWIFVLRYSLVLAWKDRTLFTHGVFDFHFS